MHRARTDDLSARQLYALLRLRVDVFVVEQHCPYPELDGRDLEPTTRHLWLAPPDDPERVLACLRLLQEPDGTRRVGRVCTARQERGRGLSRRLMEAALAEVGDAPAVLDAQVYVADFYASFGFRVTGPEFLEDGIPHVEMRRPGR